MTVSSVDEGIAALDGFDPPYVVKADGLAAGKGVVIADERDEAVDAMRASLERPRVRRRRRDGRDRGVPRGPEVSAFGIADGRDVVTLALAQDHKRVDDGDAGPNTGGMGAVSPVPLVDERSRARIRDEVLEPTVRALAAEGVPYVGVVYAGLIVTAEGPKLLEYNARFGDPETQVLMPRLRSDLGELLAAAADGSLAGVPAPALEARRRHGRPRERRVPGLVPDRAADLGARGRGACRGGDRVPRGHLGA